MSGKSSLVNYFLTEFSLDGVVWTETRLDGNSETPALIKSVPPNYTFLRESWEHKRGRRDAILFYNSLNFRMTQFQQLNPKKLSIKLLILLSCFLQALKAAEKEISAQITTTGLQAILQPSTHQESYLTGGHRCTIRFTKLNNSSKFLICISQTFRAALNSTFAETILNKNNASKFDNSIEANQQRVNLKGLPTLRKVHYFFGI